MVIAHLITVPSGKGLAAIVDLRTFREKTAIIVLGGGLPVAAIVACVGACVACKKCDAYRNKKSNHYRRVNEDK